MLRRGASSALEIVTVDAKHYVHTFDISAIGVLYLQDAEITEREIPERK